jgi:uracil-DNA glycosylase
MIASPEPHSAQIRVDAAVEPPQLITRFVAALASRPAPDRTFNPWRDTCQYDVTGEGPAGRRARLTAHLECSPRIVLVGEAPGFQGARYSGVAFTSERLLCERGIPRVGRTNRFTTPVRAFNEPSATIVWGALDDLGIASSAVLWNAFPFHPFDDGPLTNRTPKPKEVRAQLEVLSDLLALYPDAEIGAIGNIADGLLARVAGARPRTKLRHPARGGATLFRANLADWTRSIGVAVAPGNPRSPSI